MSRPQFSGDALAQAKREIQTTETDTDAAVYALAFAAIDIAESLRAVAKSFQPVDAIAEESPAVIDAAHPADPSKAIEHDRSAD